MHEAGYVYSIWNTKYHFPFWIDNYILYILYYLVSPLNYCMLIFDLMRNLHIYNACINFHSITHKEVIKMAFNLPRKFNMYNV